MLESLETFFEINVKCTFNVVLCSWYFRTGNVILNSCNAQAPNLFNSFLLKL